MDIALIKFLMYIFFNRSISKHIFEVEFSYTFLNFESKSHEFISFQMGLLMSFVPVVLTLIVVSAKLDTTLL